MRQGLSVLENKMSRPEDQGPPELYYNESEALKYTQNSRIIKIQRDMALRAIDLLEIDMETRKNPLILDIGCGSGLAGSVLIQRGYHWLGLDISLDMLQIANQRINDGTMIIESENDYSDCDDTDNSYNHSFHSEREETDGDSNSDNDMEEENTDCYTNENDNYPGKMKKYSKNNAKKEGKFMNNHNNEISNPSSPFLLGDLFLQDMGQGVGFRPGTFDGAISISALQWLFHSNKSNEVPYKRILRLFTTLHASLCRGARAIFQFYPKDSSQTDMIMQIALKTGFGGGVIIDHPDSLRRKKYFLCLMTGGSKIGINLNLPKALNDKDISNDQENHVQVMKNKSFLSIHNRNNHHDSNLDTSRKGKKSKIEKNHKKWILSKKEMYRKRGREDLPQDSKYTGRKRKIRF